jgi:hypothetical protein
MDKNAGDRIIERSEVGKRVSMVKSGIKLVIVALMFGFASSASAQTAVGISDILRTPSDYDRTGVAVSGNIKQVKIDAQYETFQVCNNSRCLWVLAWGHAALQEGQFLTVSGEFRVAKAIGPCTLRNIIVVQKGTL